MTYRVVMQPGAEADVAEAFAYLQSRSPANAQRWLRGLYASIGRLEAMPKRCGLARENNAFKEEIRQLLYGKRQHKYRILFTVRGEDVHVLHVRHAARQSLDPEGPPEEPA